MRRAKLYYKLTKPGIIRGNAVHVVAGALLASTGQLDWTTIGAVLIGTSLVIASACVANNYIDRDIDAKMNRTKTRASVTGEVSLKSAVVYAAILGLAGFAILIVFTSLLVTMIGAAAYFLYVVAYGIAKRRTIHSTLVGAIPGALPAMAGFVAVDGAISYGSVLVFLLVAAWQMPHFYAISVFRRSEYAEAGIPVMAVVKPHQTVRYYILAYVAVYALAIAALIACQVVVPSAGILLIGGALAWFLTCIDSKLPAAEWARSVFKVSLFLPLLLLFAGVINMFAAGS